jgi:hypothetical protein
MKAIITLKCEGRQDKGFRFCSGVENEILDLEKIEIKENYIDLIKYIDRVTGIFDGPCFKLQVISNAIYKMFEMGFIDDLTYKYFSHFYEMHKKCGLILLAKAK